MIIALIEINLGIIPLSNHENFTKEPSMPKMKSVKGAVKRFKVKKNGSVKRGTAFRSHILTKQDAQTRREQNTPKVIAKVDEKNIKAMIN